ncbi:MAG: sigma-70 family RNA polymerase sigma factor [Candidatus Metalachnospira sp.]|nr:sigma-70 family RNA polymerase sigma factor [Candidatus Metalachnospira sp.]
MSPDLSAQYDRIYKYCYFKTGDAVLAEDLTQETFLRFYKGGSYEERGKVMAYLYTIAGNLCRDNFRKERTEQIDDNIPAHERDLDLTLAVRSAVDSLDSVEKEIIVLRIINGQSAAETADITGLSRFSVYRKQKAALKKLKDFLGGDFCE